MRTPLAIQPQNKTYQRKELAATCCLNHVRLSPGLKNCHLKRRLQQPRFVTAWNPLGRSAHNAFQEKADPTTPQFYHFF